MTNVYLWLGAVILFGIIEALTVGIVSIWFSIGALAALIAAALHAAPWLQITVFLAVSAVALIITRPLIKKKILLRTTPTNTDMLIGEKGTVDEEIDNLAGTGSVKIAGKIWSAKSENGDVIPSGSTVTAVRIEGVKLIVKL